MIQQPCPACHNENAHRTINATDLFFGSLDNFTYHHCTECGHMQLQHEDHVRGGEFGRGTFEDKDERLVVGVLDHPILGWGFYTPRGGWVGKHSGLGPDHAVLDVGAGSGHFLANLRGRYGCACTGLDLDPTFEQKAAKNGIRRVTGDFADYQTDERFDLITMFHLIEHLDDPRAAVCKAFDLLKPGGYLYIETPAADSLAFRLFGKYWLPLLPPYHRHMFSRRSLAALIAEDFTPENCGTPLATYVPGEIMFSTWLWFARVCPHPFRRTKVAAAVKYAALAGMTVTSILALPFELVVCLTTEIVDQISRRSVLLAAHQRLLVRKPV